MGWGESWVNQEHQAYFAQFAGNRAPIAKAPLGRKGGFEIDLTATAGGAGYTVCRNHLTDSVLIPSSGEYVPRKVGIILVVGVPHVLRHARNTQSGNL